MSLPAIDHITFVHGWGMGPEIWEPLIAALPTRQTHLINLGYKGAPKTYPPPQKSLYITHSYGTMWALLNQAEHMSGLIVINGFTNFAAFTPARILARMQKRLHEKPEEQMHDFYKACGYEGEPSSLNFEALEEGLDSLAQDNAQQAFANLKVPALFLGGSDDPIAPPSSMSAQTLEARMEICEKGGHMLPLTHTQWCAQRIKDFVQEIK